MSLNPTQGVSAAIPAAPVAAAAPAPAPQAARSPVVQAQSTINYAPSRQSHSTLSRTAVFKLAIVGKLKAWAIWFSSVCGLVMKRNQPFPNVVNLNAQFPFMLTEAERLTAGPNSAERVTASPNSSARAQELRLALQALNPALNANDSSHITFRDTLLQRVNTHLNPLLGVAALPTVQNMRAISSEIQRLETEVARVPQLFIEERRYHEYNGMLCWEYAPFNPDVNKMVQQIDDLLNIYSQALCGNNPGVISLKARCKAMQVALEPFLQYFVNRSYAYKASSITNAISNVGSAEIRHAVNSDFTRRLNRVATDQEYQEIWRQPNALEQLQPILSQYSGIDSLISVGVLISFLRRNFSPAREARVDFNGQLRCTLEDTDTRFRDILKSRLPQGTLYELQSSHPAIATRAKAMLKAIIGTEIGAENASIQAQRDPDKRLQFGANTILSSHLTSAMDDDRQPPSLRVLAWIRGRYA